MHYRYFSFLIFRYDFSWPSCFKSSHSSLVLGALYLCFSFRFPGISLERKSLFTVSIHSSGYCLSKQWCITSLFCKTKNVPALHAINRTNRFSCYPIVLQLFCAMRMHHSKVFIRLPLANPCAVSVLFFYMDVVPLCRETR